MPLRKRPLDRDRGVLRDASLIVIASEDTYAQALSTSLRISSSLILNVGMPYSPNFERKATRGTPASSAAAPQRSGPVHRVSSLPTDVTRLRRLPPGLATREDYGPESPTRSGS